MLEKVIMVLNINGAHFRYGATTVFSNVSAEINEGDRIGIVGVNGAGKSTLLNCIAGELTLFEGSINKGSATSIGYLRQNHQFESNATVFEELLRVFDYHKKLLHELNSVAQQMSNAKQDDYQRLSQRYDRLMAEINRTDAYNVEIKVNTVINGMGLRAFHDSCVNTLSGGEKTKVALCKLLLEQPNLLILDEPTNHLDYKTLDWLESYLAGTRSALLIVSHDRYFLDKLCNKIWSMENGTLYPYNGNYTQYTLLRQQYIERQTKLYEQQQKQIDKLTDYIARNKVRASTANMAKSREKQLERMQLVDKPQQYAIPPRFVFQYSSAPSEKVLEVSNLSVKYGERTVLDKCNLEVNRGNKIALMGLNGTGKSTLLKHILNPLPQEMGAIVYGKNVRTGYYDQENNNLHSELNVMDELWQHNLRLSQTEVRSRLATAGFVGEDAFKQVGVLSGGERARLGLCILTALDNNFLILDEPTNHLDLMSRGALESALQKYDGTILFVSHDRYFVNSIATAVAELENGTITVYNGNYDNFVTTKKSMMQTATNDSTNGTAGQGKNNSSADKNKSGNSSYRSAKQRAQSVNIANRIKQIEKRIVEIEAQEQAINEQLTQKDVVNNYVLVNSLCKQLEELKQESDTLYEEWEGLQQ